MVTTIRGVASKFIKSNKFIIVSSIFSIIISTALIISMCMLFSNAEKSMKNNMKMVYGDMDLSVGINLINDKKLDKTTVDKISSLKEIKEISPVIIGELDVQRKDSFKVYSVGLDNSALTKSKYKYKKDISKDEVIINNELKESIGANKGDIITIGGRKLEIIDIIKSSKQMASIPNMVYINLNTFKEILKHDGEATFLLIKLIDENKNIEVAEKIKNIDENLRIDISQQDDFMKKNIASLKKFIIVLAALVIIMCALFIISNFQIFLYNYRKQFSIIRAIGGSAKQAFEMVFIQATFMNLIGVSLGGITSYLSNKYVINELSNKFSLKITDIEFSNFQAIGIALIVFLALETFMLIPAVKSSRILPLKITEKNEEISQGGAVGKFLGKTGLVVSLMLVIAEIWKLQYDEEGIVYGLMAAVVLIISVYKLLPYYIKEILEKILPIFKLISGNGAVVAIKNLIPQVKKSSVIIFSLSTIVVIGIFGETLFGTIEKNEEKFLRTEFALPISVTDRNGLDSKLGNEFKNDLKNLDEVKNVITLSCITSLYFETNDRLEYGKFLLADFDGLIKEELIPNIKGDLKSSIIISKKFADQRKLSVGDTIKITKYIEGKKIKKINSNLDFDKFIVKGIVDESSFLGINDITMDWSNKKYIDRRTNFYRALISSNKEESTLKSLYELKRKYPQIKYTTLNQALAESRQAVFQRWSIFIIVLAIILVSLFLGIVNILVNNILSKRKEYAILRTLKLDKKGLVKLILTQIAAYISIGTVLGCVLGTIVSNIVRGDLNDMYVYIGYKTMLIMIVLLVVVSIAVAVPMGRSLANKKIAEEIRLNER